MSQQLEPTDGVGTPDPSPRHLVSWCFQYKQQYYIVINWVSGALVGVGGSDFIS